ETLMTNPTISDYHAIHNHPPTDGATNSNPYDAHTNNTNSNNYCIPTLLISTNSSYLHVVSLNKHWHKWNMAVKEATNKYIPITKAIPKPFHAFSFKATKLHQALKLSNKARKLILSLPFPKLTQTIIDKTNAILQQIEQLMDYPIPNIIQQDLWT
ncbi:13420_t:CDS:2, partial [Gigaspora margarita]